MEIFIYCFAISFSILFVAWLKYGHKIDFKEFIIIVLLQIASIAGLSAISHNVALSDVEIWNSSIVDKKKVEVSCEHSYECNCYYTESCSTNSDGSRSCSTTKHCSTCYDHSNDWDWMLYDGIGGFEVPRIDRRGSDEPPRWTQVKIGDPTARYNRYKNYFLADSQSLYTKSSSNVPIPAYPNHIYDIYKVSRIITEVNINKDQWDKELSIVNSLIGPAKQANLIIYLTKNRDVSYSSLVEKAWLNGKKNDIIVMIDSDGSKINWSEVIGMSYPDFKVSLKNVVYDYGRIDVGVIAEIHSHILKNFKRRPMKEFEYLMKSIRLKTSYLVTAIILSIIITLVMVWLAINNNNDRRRW